jgi:hypothetical protein
MFEYQRTSHARRFCTRACYVATQLLAGKPVYPRRPLEERFWSRVVCDIATRCWLWTGKPNSNGYGVIALDVGSLKRNDLVHRVAYQLTRRAIPPGMEIDHVCRNRLCVRSDHLEAVPHRVNVWRGAGLTAGNARKQTCPLGHAYDLLVIRSNGQRTRRCRRCERARSRASHARLRQRQAAAQAA